MLNLTICHSPMLVIRAASHCCCTYVVWCTIHINHAVLTFAIKDFSLHFFNSLYSASLIARIGRNFITLQSRVASFLSDPAKVQFVSGPAPASSWETSAMRKLLGLGQLGTDSFVQHPCGARVLELFPGAWWRGLKCYPGLSTKQAFEDVTVRLL